MKSLGLNFFCFLLVWDPGRAYCGMRAGFLALWLGHTEQLHAQLRRNCADHAICADVITLLREAGQQRDVLAVELVCRRECSCATAGCTWRGFVMAPVEMAAAAVDTQV